MYIAGPHVRTYTCARTRIENMSFSSGFVTNCKDLASRISSSYQLYHCRTSLVSAKCHFNLEMHGEAAGGVHTQCTGYHPAQ